jgi:cytochrome c-type biogenesis protein CcmF
MGESLGPTTWIVRLYHKPFISWIWSGCLMMGFGGFLAAFDRRYRVKARAAQAAAVRGLGPEPSAAG